MKLFILVLFNVLTISIQTKASEDITAYIGKQCTYVPQKSDGNFSNCEEPRECGDAIVYSGAILKVTETTTIYNPWGESKGVKVNVVLNQETKNLYDAKKDSIIFTEEAHLMENCVLKKSSL